MIPFPFYLILCGLGATAAVTFAICVVIDKMITMKEVNETVRDESLSIPKAFKYKIMEAKKNSVKVGIFDSKENQLKEITLNSKKGVSENIQKKEKNVWKYC